LRKLLVSSASLRSSENQERALARRNALFYGGFELEAFLEDDFQKGIETFAAREEALMVKAYVPRRLDADPDSGEHHRRAYAEVYLVAEELIAHAAENLVGEFSDPIVIGRADAWRRNALRELEGDTECESAAQMVGRETQDGDDVMTVIFAGDRAALVAISREHAFDGVL
jgi:hypothetical protein